MEEDKLIREMRKVFKTHHDLLEHVGADNVGNAKKKIDRERAEFQRTKEQLQEVVNALDVDNWRNAVVRAKTLLSKLEKEGLPVWLRSISPYWVGKVAPSSYKYWHRFCKEQFLVALGQLQEDIELGLEVDLEEQIELMKGVYLNSRPEEFVEAVSAYIQEPAEEGADETE
jgi:hypothetical protein